MKSQSRTILFLAFVAFAIAYPTPAEVDPEYGDHFEGDIILSPSQKVDLKLGNRNGLIDEKYRWPQKKVFYKFFQDQHDEAHRNHIRRGMQILEEISCLRFYEADDTMTTYINITGESGGCFSNVGYLGKTQRINYQVYELDSGCFRLGTIVHEFLHSLGFYHQQSASDRDKFVHIALENIQEGKEHNFNIYNDTVVEDFGIEYDYGSVLHYSSTAFSKNGEKTIIPIDPNAEIGQRKGLSSKDIYKLNTMYKCPIEI